MELVLRIEMREVVAVPELTHYNHLTFRLTGRTMFGITHVVEKYDDVDDTPTYHLCELSVNGELCYIAGGNQHGDYIMSEGSIGCGGQWVEINIDRPDFLA